MIPHCFHFACYEKIKRKIQTYKTGEIVYDCLLEWKGRFSSKLIGRQKLIDSGGQKVILMFEEKTENNLKFWKMDKGARKTK